MNLTNETTRVKAELVMLRDRYLPRLLPADALPRCQPMLARLADLLPGPAGQLAPASAEDFLAFGQTYAAPYHHVRDGRIVWRISVMTPIELEDERARILLERAGIDPGRPGGYWDRVSQHLDEVEEWFLELSPAHEILWNGLSWLVPPLANLDPPFARLALDSHTWVVRALNHADLAPAERQRRAAAAQSPHFGIELNSALLHVLAALASNHFAEIEHYLDHPNIQGGGTHLMPRYLFAVLSTKVQTLRQLAADGA